MFSNLSKSISYNFLFTNSSFLNYGIPLISENSSICSRTVRFSNNPSNYGQYPILYLAYSYSVVTLLPATHASPDVGLISPDNILNVVVFPAPLTPKSPKTSPFSI